MAFNAHLRKTSALVGGLAPLILLSLASPAFAQASAPAPAAAPDKADKDDNAIIVTGTLFKNKAAASASPIVTISSSDLAARGINTVSDALQKLSSNNAGTLTTGWTSFGFATGASTPSLRGLDDSYTLVTFDGMRSAPYPLADDTHRNFTDINTIPESIVDHIDVLQDGASSQYGSDAIAGVVNVIIKKQIQGFHANVSGAISSHRDYGEQRADASYGYGDLASQGFNFWVNAEYQKNDPLYLRDRSGPYGTADHSNICGSSLGTTDENGNVVIPVGTKTCGVNGIANGIQADGSYSGLVSTTTGIAAIYDPTASDTNNAGSQFQFLNPAAGCQGLASTTLTDAQRLSPTNAYGAATPTTVCQEDRVKEFYQDQPSIKRLGANARLTVDITPDIQAYAMFNFNQVKTISNGSNSPFANITAAGGTQVQINQIILPAYICPAGTVACTAANGTLNPNNPYAASGQSALLLERYDQPETTFTNGRTFRGSAGVSGTFGDGWNFNADFTTSRVLLNLKFKNYLNLRDLLNAIADGSYNFADQGANSDAARQTVAPTLSINDRTSLTQVQAQITKSFFQLPGGPLQFAFGGAYRKESISEPSANPVNEVDPYDRYVDINGVEVEGARNVKSGFFQINAPILKMVSLTAQGRYDSYSTGQSNFSPKFEATFQPIRQIKIRGTYSKGFRVPSLAEAFGKPATGYQNTTFDLSDPAQAAYVAAHGNNAYVNNGYSYGSTSSGNPNLSPEKSTQWTVGVVLQPTSALTITADYFNIKIKDLIGAPPQCLNLGPIAAQYYANNGVVNIPGCTVTPGAVDPAHPTLLPEIGQIAYSYINSGTEEARGVDLSATLRLPLGHGVRWTSTGTATYLAWLGQIQNDGTKVRYDGSLSPCNITSCSGSPKWRASWENTLEVKNMAFTATAYYTAGYHLESTDYGGVVGDCAGSVGASVVAYADGVTPIKCNVRAFVDVDFTASIKIADKLTLYTNILNVFGVKAPYDPSAGYSLYQFNPAWADQGFIGRYFRIGAKVDL